MTQSSLTTDTSRKIFNPHWVGERGEMKVLMLTFQRTLDEDYSCMGGTWQTVENNCLTWREVNRSVNIVKYCLPCLPLYAVIESFENGDSSPERSVLRTRKHWNIIAAMEWFFFSLKKIACFFHSLIAINKRSCPMCSESVDHTNDGLFMHEEEDRISVICSQIQATCMFLAFSRTALHNILKQSMLNV